MIHPSDDAASTIQWLYRHAKGAPESTAVVTPARQNTYGELASRVLAVAAELQRIGVAPGMLIGIETNDRFAHLATVLACDVIGATTLSFYASEFDASRDELGRCSMLLHDRDLPAAVTTAAPRRIRTILGAAAASPPAIDLARLDRSIPSDHALRVIRSSGTTGNKKCMAFRMGVVRACIDRIVDTFGLEDSDAPDIFVPYGLPLRAAYLDTMVGLKLGRCVIYGSVDQPPLVGRHHATLSVGELSRFIRALSQGTEKLDMSISVAAGKVPPNLLAALRARCTGPVFDIYSSNETHWIAVTDGGDASRLLPGVEARIVDAFGTPVSPGQRGYLEVRTDRKVEGYLWNEPATRQYFAGDWFRPFDYAFLTPEGMLSILGRVDGLINVAGVKIAPGPIEERLAALPGITGACLVSVPDENGVETLQVVLECTERALDAGLQAQIHNLLGTYVFYYRLRRADRLPRTENGKVRLADLRSAVAAGQPRTKA